MVRVVVVAVTVTVVVALNPPLVFSVIEAVPAATAVTKPDWLTVAMEVLPLVHV